MNKLNFKWLKSEEVVKQAGAELAQAQVSFKQQQSQNIFLEQSESQKLLETLRNSPN